MRDNRASRPETKAVGKWSMNGDGAYDRYDHSLPIEGMLAAASFNARHPEAYMILRNSLGEYLLWTSPFFKLNQQQNHPQTFWF